MNPIPYIHIFAIVAILALCLHVFSSFWVPLTLGAGVFVTLAILFRRQL